MLRAAANALVRTLLEPACPACGLPLDRPLDGAVCGPCWAAVPRLAAPLCGVCGDPVPASGADRCPRCLTKPPSFRAARSAGLHAGSLRAIIHAFKYDGRRTLAVPLAALMREAGAELLKEADLAVPVPLHPWRAVSRGFNQADDLARHLGVRVCQPLRRIQYGPAQVQLTGRASRERARDAFGRRIVGVGPWAAERLRGRHVVLVDDVMTTGATVEGCTRVLLEAEAASVAVLTVARAPAPPPAPLPREPRPSTTRRR